MKRAAILTALAAVAGCSSGSDSTPLKAEGAEHIACALGGAKSFTEACAVDRSTRDGKLSLIVRHPDGAFRRFAVVTDGRGVVVADGAEQATTALEDGKLAVTVGQDRYLFPARTKPTGMQKADGRR